MSYPPAFDGTARIGVEIVGAPNFHLYVTPSPDFLQSMFMREVLKGEVVTVTPDGGEFNANDESCGLPLLNLIALGPLVAFTESSGLTLYAHTSH